jgi:hypothetical protein
MAVTLTNVNIGTVAGDGTGDFARTAFNTINTNNDAIETALAGDREGLTADRTYYVRTDGSDSNTGLANTAGGAFLTIQKAVDVAMTIDAKGYNVTIKVADGTYTGTVNIQAAPVGISTKSAGTLGVFTIEGNTTTPANCVISTTSDCFSITGPDAYVTIKGFKLTSSTKKCISVYKGGVVTTGVMEYGSASSDAHIGVYDGVLAATAAYTISGSALYHLLAEGNAVIYVWDGTWTITLTGTPAFTSFVYSAENATVFCTQTFSGSATGVRYQAELNGVIRVFGAGATYFPGNSAGTTATGGQYA